MDLRAHISPLTRLQPLDPFVLELGGRLDEVVVAYRTWGVYRGNNAVLVCHALTGNADADDWWQPLFGPGRSLDPERDFIVCSNILGSCYGTTGPTSRNPATGRPWGPDFPAMTIRDMVHLQAALLDRLGVTRLQLAVGGSLGGMQVLEWAQLYPDRVAAIAPIACSGRHSAWCIGLSEAQRQAIFADPLWQGGHYRADRPPAAGLAAARMVAMCSYRSWTSFERRFGRRRAEGDTGFAVGEYLAYQGQQLVRRFDANSYVTLSCAMDTHDLGRDHPSFEEALGAIQAPALVVAIDSDVLYPSEEQQELARLIPNAELAWLHSEHGHDAFLIDMEALDRFLVGFRAGKRLHTF